MYLGVLIDWDSRKEGDMKRKAIPYNNIRKLKKLITNRKKKYIYIYLYVYSFKEKIRKMLWATFLY